MATTAIIDSFDANTGAIVFSGNGSGTIHAMGDIEASDGYIGFFAPEIINSGSLQADAGSIALSTETNGTLYLPGFAGVGFNIDKTRGQKDKEKSQNKKQHQLKR